MPHALPACRTVTVFTFRGDQSRTNWTSFARLLTDGRTGAGPGPTPLQCLLFSGHTGLSTDDGATVYGFKPDGGRTPTWEVYDRLENGEAFPGVVTDDAPVFAAARAYPLAVVSFGVVLPEPVFQGVCARLDAERTTSQYAYGFPNGDGDCNCTTWLERIGLPLLTGRMNEFTRLMGFTRYPTRRFGACV